MVLTPSPNDEKMLAATRRNPMLRALFDNLTPELALAFKDCQLLLTDFDGVLTPNTIFVNAKGEEFVQCNRSDGFGLKLLRALDLRVEVLILSTETNKVVTARAAKLDIRCLQGLTDKGAALEQEMNNRNLRSNQVAYIGNDVNDIACLEKAGLPIIVADAYPGMEPYARYITRARGGYGAFREVCELILLAKLGLD